jgi:hypothetical protein
VHLCACLCPPVCSEVTNTFNLLFEFDLLRDGSGNHIPPKRVLPGTGGSANLHCHWTCPAQQLVALRWPPSVARLSSPHCSASLAASRAAEQQALEVAQLFGPDSKPVHGAADSSGGAA